MLRSKTGAIGIAILTLAALAVAGIAWTAIPEKINYQGRLVDSGTGLPLPGTYPAVFKIYNDSTDGTLLWSETTSVTADSNGVFTALLGSVTPITISFDVATYLQVEIDGETLTPRRELVSSPYAFNSMNAENLNGLPASDYATGDDLGTVGTINDPSNPVDWSQLKNVPAGFADGADDVGGSGDGHSLDADDGSPVDVVYVDNTGKVGIGITTPAEKLHVVGDIRLDSGGDIAFANDNTRVYHSTDDLRLTADDDLYLTPDDDIQIAKDGEGPWARFDSDQKWLGLGTGAPAYNLHVHEASGAANYLLLTNSTTGATSSDGLQVGINGAGAAYIYCQENQYFRIGNNDEPRITIDTDGDVGIGTQTATSRLTVEATYWGDIVKIKNDGTDNGLFLSSGSVWASLSGGTSNDDHIVIRHATGNVGIGGLTDPDYPLEVSGRTAIVGTESSWLAKCQNYSTSGTGVMAAGSGVTPYYWSAGSGVAATGNNTGLFVRASQLGNANQEAIYCYLAQSGQYAVVCYRDGIGNQYKIMGDGIAATVMPTSKGRVALACPESPEAWIEDFGSGSAAAGRGHIELDPMYLDCITVNDSHPLKVFVQLTSPAANQYYVEKGKTGFDVVFVGDGADKVSATFDYKVVGKWKGNEDFRFAPVEEEAMTQVAFEPEPAGPQNETNEVEQP
jgi:hypothetical protein